MSSSADGEQAVEYNFQYLNKMVKAGEFLLALYQLKLEAFTDNEKVVMGASGGIGQVRKQPPSLQSYQFADQLLRSLFRFFSRVAH